MVVSRTIHLVMTLTPGVFQTYLTMNGVTDLWRLKLLVLRVQQAREVVYLLGVLLTDLIIGGGAAIMCLWVIHQHPVGLVIGLEA